jgi:CHASE3 domain sensor protein
MFCLSLLFLASLKLKQTKVVANLHIMKNKKIILTTIAVCIIIIAYNLFTLFKSYNKISDKYNSVQSKYDFAISSHSLLENIKDAESAKRGYLLTGNKAYLENYYKASFRINFEKERFKKILAYKELEKNEQDQINQLLNLVDLKSEQLRKVIDLKNNDKSEEAIALLKSYNAISLFDSLENSIKKINSQKKYQEIKDKQIINDTRETTKFKLAIGHIIILLLLVIIGILISEDKTKSLSDF